MDVRVGLWRKLSAEELMLLNCGVGEDSWALKKIPGVIYAETSVVHEDGSATFIVESKNEIDVRKPIFFMLAQRSWPILSLEFTGANLEDIFISVVDEADAEKSAGKKD